MTDPAAGQIVPFCIYQTVTGRILRMGACQFAQIDSQPINPGETAMALNIPVSANKWYIDVTQTPPAPASRPAYTGIPNKLVIKGNGTDPLLVTGLPNGTICNTNGKGGQTSDTIDGGTFAWITVVPGDYYLHIDPFPMQESNVVIKAEA